jgi:hypothetical protein
VLFTKKIIQPGTYTVDRPGGGTSRVYVGPERIKRIAETFDRMRENGLRIPAPWRHDPKAKPVRLDMDEQDVDSYNNAGFWTKVWQEDDGSLYGELDVKDRKAQSKVGKTVVECSPRLDPCWGDGEGDKYEDAMTHCALVTHPVIRNQDNFEPVEEPGIALSLGSYVAATDVTALFASDASMIGVDSSSSSGNEGFDNSANGPTGHVRTAVQSLALAGIPLPEDTSDENLAEYITVALRAYVAGRDQSDDGGLQSPTKRPKGSKEEKQTVIMSKELQAVIANQSQIADKLTAGEELTIEFLEGLSADAGTKPEPAQFSKEQEAMLRHAEQQMKDGYKVRIERCVQKGQMSPAACKEKFIPLLEAVEFSFGADGEQVVNHLDVCLDVVESIPEGAFLTGKSPTTVKQSKADIFGAQTFSLSGLTEEEAPSFQEPSETAEPSEEEGEALALSLLEKFGVPH